MKNTHIIVIIFIIVIAAMFFFVRSTGPTDIVMPPVEDNSPEVVAAPEGWQTYTTPANDLSFALPEGYIVTFDSNIISMQTGEDDYFPLTTFRKKQGVNPLKAYLSDLTPSLSHNDIKAFPHSMYDHISIIDTPVYQIEAETLDEPYTHRIYVVAVPDTDSYYFFSGWEAHGISDWEHIVPFLGSITVQ